MALDANDIARERGVPGVRAAWDAAHQKQPTTFDARQEPPRQLYRHASAPESFPVDAMGSTLEPVTRAIIELTQAPDGICANSVLGAASLAAQAHADIQLPGLGRPHPITLFLLTIAPSGERKTTADREALIGVRNRERELREGYKEEFNHHRNATDVYEAARSEALKKTKTDLASSRFLRSTPWARRPSPVEADYSRHGTDHRRDRETAGGESANGGHLLIRGRIVSWRPLSFRRGKAKVGRASFQPLGWRTDRPYQVRRWLQRDCWQTSRHPPYGPA